MHTCAVLTACNHRLLREHRNDNRRIEIERRQLRPNAVSMPDASRAQLRRASPVIIRALLRSRPLTRMLAADIILRVRAGIAGSRSSSLQVAHRIVTMLLHLSSKLLLYL